MFFRRGRRRRACRLSPAETGILFRTGYSTGVFDNSPAKPGCQFRSARNGGACVQAQPAGKGGA
ncbi:hypothetical protein A7X67_06890 [Clostridium sp. W14A]|nr:hypothetical protein A7X67_06890 [Clostridium sp. W14A]